ncbi:MAG: DsbA family protein [Candidatus Woesebacteria bacterium]|nr:MAG: DsbA family protein [Candidatus Woesebacteria bacterium]
MRLLDRFSSVFLVVIFALVFGMGILWQKVTQLEKGSVSGTTTTNTATTTNPTPAQQAATVTLDQIKKLFANNDLIKFGDANRKVLFVEVGDPSCPYCHVAGGEDPQLNSQMGATFKLDSDGGTYQAPVTGMRKLVDSGKASFLYVYFPGHGNGEMGMKALYCADEKGKFWEAHDLIMSNSGYNLMNNDVKNDKAQSQKVADFLKNVVDSTFMKSCLDSGKYDSKLTSDTTIAQGLGVSGTPGFFVNTTPFAGAYSFKDMQGAIDSALK